MRTPRTDCPTGRLVLDGRTGDPPAPSALERGLTGTDLLDWIALRRICEGYVAMFGSEYFDHGRRVPCYLPEVFGRLAEAELTELRDADFPGGRRGIVLTPLGRDRYHDLEAMRRSSLYLDRLPDGWSVPLDRPLSRWRPVRGCSGGTTR